MLGSRGFDLWADGYDKSVGVSDEESTYPFAGYKRILGDIYKIIMEKPKSAVLENKTPYLIHFNGTAA